MTNLSGAPLTLIFPRGINMKYSEAIKKFGHIPLYFLYYYKYVFAFEGEDDDFKVHLCCGGNHDDIFNFEVEPKIMYYFGELSAEIFIEITNKKTKEILFKFEGY